MPNFNLKMCSQDALKAEKERRVLAEREYGVLLAKCFTESAAAPKAQVSDSIDASTEKLMMVYLGS